MNAYRGPPMTLGNAAAAGVRFVVWCGLCGHQVDLEPADQAACYGAALSVPHWRTRLVCGACGSRHVSMVVAGTERYPAGPG